MKKFFVLWSSQAASLFGSSIVNFALAWYLKEITGSATILSTAMMMNILPIVFLGPFIGPFIDRWNRKKILIYSDLISMLLTVLLVVLFFTDTIQIWQIYVVMFCRAVSGTFQGPALRASVPMIVQEKHLVRVNGLTATLGGLIDIISIPSGAFLMKVLSMQWVLSVDIITALIAIGCLLPLGIPQPLRTTLKQKVNAIREMLQGFRYIVSWKALFFLLILCAMLNFFGNPLNTLLPLFVERYLGNDILKLGWLGTAFGTGVLAGGLILSAWGGFKKRIVTSFIGFMVSCIPVIIFGFTTEGLYIMGLAMWFLSGFGLALSNAPVGAILQSTVPKDMQGRVFSVLGSVCTAVIPIGLAITGPIANVIELRWIYIFSGILMVILILTSFFFGNLLSIENQKPAEKPEESQLSILEL